MPTFKDILEGIGGNIVCGGAIMILMFPSMNTLYYGVSVFGISEFPFATYLLFIYAFMCLLLIATTFEKARKRYREMI